MEFKSRCLAADRRNEIGDLLRGIVDLDGQGDPDPSRDWQAGVLLVDITRTLQGGRSGAAAYEMTVHRPGRPARRQVLKVGPLADIITEWRAYRTWLAGTLSATVTPVEAVSRTVSETAGPERLGAIVYQHVATYAGRSSVPVSTLEETVRGAIDGSIPLGDTLAVVRALLEQLDESVWHTRSESQRHTLVGLNALLGPDLVLEVDRAANANTLTFQSPTNEQRRDKVRYSGAVLERASLLAPQSGPEALTLDATIELRDMSTSAGPHGHLLGQFGDTTVEIRTAAGADPHFQLLDYAGHPSLTVVGRVVALRGLSWWAKIEHAVDTARRDGDAVVIDGVPLGDPFAALPSRITEFRDKRATTVVHGDLNPRNVLLVDRQIFLIDFARTGVGPPLSDAAWLEICLLRDVIAPVLGWPALVRLQRELAVRTRVADAVEVLPEPAGRAAAVLWEIRAGAQRCHRRRETTHPWWPEYQDQLLISSLRTLKWDDQTSAEIYAAMAVAGVAAEQLGPRPYRHWQAEETLATATAVLPLLNAKRTESLAIAAEFVTAVDQSGLSDDDERVVPFETALPAWRDAYVVAHHIESAAVVLAQLADDHDVYVSLQAFIRVKGQLQSGGFGYWAGSPFAQNPFDYPSRPNPFDYLALPSPFDVRDLTFEESLAESDRAESQEQEEGPRPAQARPAWAAVEIRDPDAIDLVISEWAVVVLGDAGSGKSTVARELQYQLARAVMSAAGRVPSPEATETPDSRRSMPPMLPVTLRAPLLHRTLNAAADDLGPRYFAEALGRILRDCLEEPVPPELLRVGAVHLTIDAFNEVDPADRARIADWIHWLRRTYARMPIVICHRRNGFIPSELPFPVVVLQSVSLEQARDYIRTALRLRKLPNHELQAATLIRLLLDQPANPTIRDFARVPLYLWMITARYAQHGVVPANVSELFAGFSQWYLTERDGDDRASRRYGYDEQVRCLEVIARNLVERGNITDITVDQAAVLLVAAELTDARERLDDLVAADMLDRDGAQLRFHHQSFQEYFAARVLYREVGDLAAFRDHVLEFRWREPLQMMLSFSGGDPDLTRRLIGIALRADSKFAASLLRWTENPPPEAVDGFLVTLRRALAAPNLGTFEWKRAADALVELGTADARLVLQETLGEPSLPVEARSAALSALLSMASSNRFEEMRDILTRDITQAVTTILQSADPTALRSEAAMAIGSAQLMPLAAYLAALIDPDEAWQVARAAWNSLTGLGQVAPPAMRRRYVAMCADRLAACRAELVTVSDKESIEELQDERIELIEVLGDAGQIQPVLAHRFAYGLWDSFAWHYLLVPENYPEITDRPLGKILAGERSAEELIAAFRGDDELEVAAAAHMILAYGSPAEIERMVASVSSSSSPTQLLAAAAAVDGSGADCASLLPMLRVLIHRFPDNRYLEATVALVSCLPTDEYELVRLRLLALCTFSSNKEDSDRFSSKWPCTLLWHSYDTRIHDFLSELMLDGEEGLRLAIYGLSTDWWLDGKKPTDPVLSSEAKQYLLAHLRSIPVSELVDGDQLKIFAVCARERMVDTIPMVIESSQSEAFQTEIVQISATYGAEETLRGCEILTYIGFLGRIAHDEGERALAQRAYSFLLELGAQRHHTMERSRLVALAILGDWVPLLSGLRTGDRRMLAAAGNAIQIWHEGAPYTPAWATDLEAVGIWIVRRLTGDDGSLAPDVRSALGEIKDWIEQQIGRNIAPA